MIAQRAIEEGLVLAGGHFTPGSFGRLVLTDGKRAWQPL
jgi:hypothetical protein